MVCRSGKEFTRQVPSILIFPPGADAPVRRHPEMRPDCRETPRLVGARPKRSVKKPARAAVSASLRRLGACTRAHENICAKRCGWPIPGQVQPRRPSRGRERNTNRPSGSARSTANPSEVCDPRSFGSSGVALMIVLPAFTGDRCHRCPGRPYTSAGTIQVTPAPPLLRPRDFFDRHPD